MGPEVRSAVRSFQERQGLPVTGLVGPDTERALIAGKGGQSPGAGATKPDEPGMTEPPEPAATPPETGMTDPAEPAPTSSDAEFDFEWETLDDAFEDAEEITEAEQEWLDSETQARWSVPTYSETSSSSQTELEDGMGEMEWEEEAAKGRSTLRYVKTFASSDADCVAAMKSAKKTRSHALAIINTQIGHAIRMLRLAANKLKRGDRSTQTKAIFQKIFRVKPESVPTWLKQTATIKDRGDVVATRCNQVANLLERGGLRYFCTISAKNCPDCPDGQDYSTTYACSSWGDESVAPKNSRVICLNTPFWKAMGAIPIDSPNILAVLMHEPFHVYYGKYVTGHGRANPGKFGAIYCTTQFVFEINGKTNYPAWMKKVCANTQFRR